MQLANDTAATTSSLESAIGKLESVLQEENTKLEANAAYEHGPFIIRKNQILRELMMLQRAEDHKSATAAMSDRLRGVRQLVTHNHALLGAQVSAMNQVTEILTNVALSESADGTYSRNQMGD
ncbi:hypothetical protein [Aestuariivirga litoralis]|uniref:hypothetical protein n=1 Tax=Aestuariivirga litoralis TaxID=2650924 RepID=UPI0018C78AC7|nr:hypothetical protein [Aestuariivirga litoralis]MBG1233170.1 hypothetical protein [Aestuariivirga litoralis]